MRKSKPESLYIHIPFCESICDYCDFAKLQYFHSFADSYLDALEKELIDCVGNKSLKTIYIGGGTPTSLSDDQFTRLLKMVHPFALSVLEYTVEANPESLSLSKINMLKKYGVNRVSIGVESTNDNILKSINRKHTFQDVQNVVSLLRNNGIDNINLDLIIGLPNVSEKMLEKDIFNILLLNPNHISCYSLTVHEHTVFHINGIEEPSEDFAFESYKKINDILSIKGYEHYEVSNWAKPGFRSEHNLTYWRNEQYYGIGLAASGYIGDKRYKNTTSFKKYISFNNEIEEETVSFTDQKQYEIMLRLRTSEGILLEDFNKKFACDFYSDNKDYIDGCIKDGLLILKDGRLFPTFDGMMVLDTICVHLE